MNRSGTQVVVIAVVVAGLLVAAGFVAYKMANNRKEAERARREAELQKEREENRLEAASLNDPTPPSAEEASEFSRVLTKFSDAIKAENGHALVELIDGERMFDEIVRQAGPGSPLKSTSANRASFTRGLRQGAQNALINP